MSPCNNKVSETISEMTDKQIIDYAESYLGLEGRELVYELSQRLRSKKAEIFHLVGTLEKNDVINLESKEVNLV